MVFSYSERGDAMGIDKKSLGLKIKGIRLSRGLTQEEFGKLFENKEQNENAANRGIVSAWERGASVPSPYRLALLAEMSNCSVNELLYGGEFDHVFSAIETSDYNLAELFYEKYIEKYGKGSYKSFDEIAGFYKKIERELKATYLHTSAYSLVVRSYIAKILSNRLEADYKFKQYFKDNFEENSAESSDRYLKHIELLSEGISFEIGYILEEVIKLVKIPNEQNSAIAKEVERHVNHYIDKGLIINEEAVSRYIRNEILGEYDKKDCFFAHKLKDEN